MVSRDALEKRDFQKRFAIGRSADTEETEKVAEIPKKEDGSGDITKELTITERVMSGKHVVDVTVQPTAIIGSLPRGESADLRVKAHKEEQKVLKAEIQIKQTRYAELQTNIEAIKNTVKPTVKDTVRKIMLLKRDL